ncbi:putative thioesterase superfamily protein [Venturia nashicola]|nr:putative thioesterase superfamily protein [Venturia nashicola]
MRTEIRAGIEHIAYFKSIPWCRALIENPSYHTSPTNSRLPKDTNEDSFLGETLQTDRTIRKCLTLNVAPDDNLNPTISIREVLTLFELGNGVNGFPNICHGGFVATLLDEVMGILLRVNQEYLHRVKGEAVEITSMTAYLNMKYLAPVAIPGIVLARTKVEKVEGRKIYTRGSIEDGKGKELTVAECLFVKARKDPRAML